MVLGIQSLRQAHSFSGESSRAAKLIKAFREIVDFLPYVNRGGERVGWGQYPWSAFFSLFPHFSCLYFAGFNTV